MKWLPVQLPDYTSNPPIIRRLCRTRQSHLIILAPMVTESWETTGKRDRTLKKKQVTDPLTMIHLWCQLLLMTVLTMKKAIQRVISPMSVLKIGRSGKGGEIRKVAANAVLNSGVVVDFCLPVEGEKYI